jgi:hypothetical protein
MTLFDELRSVNSQLESLIALRGTREFDPGAQLLYRGLCDREHILLGRVDAQFKAVGVSSGV